ncbi:MAG: DUF2911 domain-containing protein [Bacteroidetes bacterium]|nr:DUF2911 domain-containing protein [Bacteroidota bacterium]
MKKLLLVACLSGASWIALQAQPLRTPAPSPTATLEQDFALSTVEVNYSRPSMKGRNIFGDLVPFGKVWRTGANAATTISFGEDVMVGGKPVPAGKYGLLTIPGESEWTVIISKQLDVTSPSAYKQDMDLVRIQVKPQNMPIAIESFMIAFDNIKANSMEMDILWDRTVVVVPITADIDSKISKQINDLMTKDNRPYAAAAAYYVENGKDLNQALSWYDKALEQNPSAFWLYYQKANCLAKMGKKADAIATAKKSIELAKTAKNDDYVALNEKLIASLK